MSGSYTGSVDLGEFSKATSITKVSTGVFYATDFFGGRYAIGRSYGSAYSLRTYFILKADNTLQALSTNSPWGPWAVLDGLFVEETFTLSFKVDLDGSGFAISLVKE